jgi:hypothetical protein
MQSMYVSGYSSCNCGIGLLGAGGPVNGGSLPCPLPEGYKAEHSQGYIDPVNPQQPHQIQLTYPPSLLPYPCPFPHMLCPTRCRRATRRRRAGP